MCVHNGYLGKCLEYLTNGIHSLFFQDEINTNKRKIKNSIESYNIPEVSKIHSTDESNFEDESISRRSTKRRRKIYPLLRVRNLWYLVVQKKILKTH